MDKELKNYGLENRQDIKESLFSGYKLSDYMIIDPNSCPDNYKDRDDIEHAIEYDLHLDEIQMVFIGGIRVYPKVTQTLGEEDWEYKLEFSLEP